ncbi:MAG: hypothetical protein PUF72_08700 [Clostridiales bacterium]|nr:hypothetical protein [Clostridiales bacterium]
MDKSLYKYKTELHAHSSPASRCSRVLAKELVRIYAENGYDTVVLTNHFTHDMEYVSDKRKCIDSYLADYYAALEEGSRCGINVVLASEVRMAENMNDYLIYGIDEEFFEQAYDYLNGGICEFSERFRNEKTVLLQAHPFRDNMVLADPKYLDGIEVFNMVPSHNSRIAVAAAYAAKQGFIASCGSDFHNMGYEALCSLLSKEEIKTSYDAARILKSGDYLMEISGFIIEPPKRKI